MTKVGLNLAVPFERQDLNFDLVLRDELGIHVYALLDPRPSQQRVVYIGKAGSSGLGSSRIIDHFEEAATFLSNVNKGCTKLPSNKIRRMLEITEAGYDVGWVILRRKIASAGEAFATETALINAFTKAAASNPKSLQRPR